MLSMCLVLILQFNFGFLISDAGGEVGLITSYICLFWLVFGVLRHARKLLIIASRGIFHIVNLSNTHPAIQFRVFDRWCRRRLKVSSLH
jgi:hypothetical protein